MDQVAPPVRRNPRRMAGVDLELAHRHGINFLAGDFGTGSSFRTFSYVLSHSVHDVIENRNLCPAIAWQRSGLGTLPKGEGFCVGSLGRLRVETAQEAGARKQTGSPSALDIS